jgi:hypothetical protein
MEVNFILKLEQVTTLLRKDLNWKFKESKDASTKTKLQVPLKFQNSD